MKTRRLHTATYLILPIIALTACRKEILLPPEPDGISASEKVRIELFAKIPEYTPPATRTGSAQENTIDMKPWVLVFKGSNDNATYVEAAQAIDMAGQRFVELTAQTTACRLLILANTQNKFTIPNGTEYDLSLANLNATLGTSTPKTLAQAADMLLTQRLNSPQTTVPFASTASVKPLIPMSYVHPVANISRDTQIGDKNNLLEMERAVAKIIVRNTASNFILRGATVVNAPRRGQLHRIGTTLLNNSGASNLTDYRATSPADPVTGIAAATVEGTTQTTDPTNVNFKNPIYIYESRSTEKTAVIIKGVYQGMDYYYKLSFVDAGNNPINILRNYQYTFTVTSVSRPGFISLTDAVNAAYGSNEAITFTITASDPYSSDIVDNGEYYLGVTNSAFIVYGDEAISNMHAFTVTTDRNTTLTDNSISVSSGLTLVSPTNGRITLASGTTLNPTDVRINMTSTFTAGTITLRLGNLLKTVTVEKRPSIEGALPYIEFSGDYLHAQIDAGNWLSLSTDKAQQQGNSVDSQNGKIYIMPAANFGTSGTPKSDGVVFLSRKNNSQGKIKVNITQKVTPIASPSMTTLPYPYIGTFHRASQTGERLIRIPSGTGNTGAWSARVIDGAEFIKLANGFNTTEGTWPYNNSSAESWQVEGDAPFVEGTQASTTGEIRFRVGMKSKLSNINPDWNTLPRYGRILVSYANHTKCWVLYVRQGEAADFLMRPNDPNADGVAVTNNRNLARRFTPFNLADPSRGAGGSSTGNHNALTTNDAGYNRAFNALKFTDFPSQAGYYFQWNTARAYNPTNSTGAISGWPQTYTTSWNTALEACPTGYRQAGNGPGSASGWEATSEATHSLSPNLVANFASYSIWGYYADGFFDRRLLETSASNQTYSKAGGGSEIAYLGRLAFNPHNHASLFFPAVGTRNNGTGSLQDVGRISAYSTTTFLTANVQIRYIYLHIVGATTNSPSMPTWGYSVRCIRP